MLIIRQNVWNFNTGAILVDKFAKLLLLLING